MLMSECRQTKLQASGAGSDPLTLSAILGIASLALQIPRSLWLKNRMFFTGTSFCSAAGCLFLRRHSQLLSVAAILYAVWLLAWAVTSQYHRTVRHEYQVRTDMVWTRCLMLCRMCYTPDVQLK